MTQILSVMVKTSVEVVLLGSLLFPLSSAIDLSLIE